MRDVVIVAAKRTAIGKFNGSLSSLRSDELGGMVIKALLQDTDIAPQEVDEVLMGQVLAAGAGQNPARQAAINAGLPFTTAATTINKVCGSGLKTVQLATQAIRCGDADIIIAGGQENMSRAPHILPNSRTGQKMGEWALMDTMIIDGLWDAFNDYHMGITAENIAQRFDISRQEQDSFAEASHRKALAAQRAGHFDSQIVPVEILQRKGEPVSIDQDESPRENVNIETLGRLRPAFLKHGTVTAGNASSLNDGAAAVMLCSAEKAKALNLTPLATIRACASAGVDPAFMGTGPIAASQRCLKLAGWTVDQLDLIEANEAFAAQAIAVNHTMKWDIHKVNVNGGAIALGHPIGSSGCRVLVTLLHEMARTNAKKGLATLCIGGGMGIAMALER